jgi:hypothetical protein
MGETEIIKLLNRAKDDFCEETGIFKKTEIITSTANQRWYSLPTGLLKVERVLVGNITIPRLQGNPIINDNT